MKILKLSVFGLFLGLTLMADPTITIVNLNMLPGPVQGLAALKGTTVFIYDETPGVISYAVTLSYVNQSGASQEATDICQASQTGPTTSCYFDVVAVGAPTAVAIPSLARQTMIRRWKASHWITWGSGSK